jgi:predicted secreted hydrolase
MPICNPIFRRRALLLALAATAGRSPAAAQALSPDRVVPLRFPVDYGAHPASRTEWWYITGQLGAAQRLWGFQVTFFRTATGIAAPPPASRFDAAELVFAHAAVTDLEGGRLRHDQRIARAGFGIAGASAGDTAVRLRDWRLDRQPRPTGGAPGTSRYVANVTSDVAAFAFELRFDSTQPVLLQGDAGLSQKGPAASNNSRYYSEPQLATTGRLTLDGKAVDVAGRAWLDHEWSDAYLPPGAVGWDWLGMNLDDGSALTAFRLRRADGSSVWAGGSFRRAGSTPVAFGPAEVGFTPGRQWTSAASKARYPVEWQVTTPAGRFGVRALLDDQELDSRNSTGAVYWEGLSDLLDDAGRRVGRGYLEMTGYADPLRL